MESLPSRVQAVLETNWGPMGPIWNGMFNNHIRVSSDEADSVAYTATLLIPSIHRVLLSKDFITVMAV